MEDNKILITDENGKEIEMNILFTFDANDRNYVICYEDDKEEDVYPFCYDENGNLFLVENEDELSLVDEVLASFDGVEEQWANQ